MSNSCLQNSSNIPRNQASSLGSSMSPDKILCFPTVISQRIYSLGTHTTGEVGLHKHKFTFNEISFVHAPLFLSPNVMWDTDLFLVPR